MTNRENYLSLLRRQGFEKIPVDFFMCPSLEKRFHRYAQEKGIAVEFDHVQIDNGLQWQVADESVFRQYYNTPLREGTTFDGYGVAHSPGSADAYHMTQMFHPMADFDSVEQVESYPFPRLIPGPVPKQQVGDRVTIGNMQCTVWEQAWYLRGMENLMMDMMSEDPIAEAILDRVTDISCRNAAAYAGAGADILFLGDDIGMQRTALMSRELYCLWLKPRLKKVIETARSVKEDILVFYHSCGYVEPFIEDLIEAGVDVLDPVQPECMDFAEIHARYHDRLSFHGTIGTQTTMPFGTPEEVRREVFKNLDIAGAKGGLLVCPTHMLEPEVPVENIAAYIQACQDYCR